MKKINSELLNISGGDLYAKRVEWSNARGKRIEFIKELNNRLDSEGVVGKERAKMYSTTVSAYDKQNMKMSWA